MKPVISVIIPAYNEETSVGTTIRAFVRASTGRVPYEIVVVDDASDDATSDAVANERKGHPVRLIRMPVRRGAPHARNVGARAATGRVLLMTDADVTVSPGWDEIVATGVGPERLVCGTVTHWNSEARGHGCALEYPSLDVQWMWTPRGDGLVPIASSTAMAIERGLFWKLGGYDDDFPFYGAAEPEFSVRAWLAGASVALCAFEASHRSRAPRNQGPYDPEVETQTFRNQLRFAFLYLEGAELREVVRHFQTYNAEAAARALEALEPAAIADRRRWLAQVWRRHPSWYFENMGVVQRRSLFPLAMSSE